MNRPWTEDLLRKSLQRHTFTQYRWSNLEGRVLNKFRKAAVLVPLFVENGEVRVWLTKRSEAVTSDKGHVSFPGGMRDSEDEDEPATCLRESHEEIGLFPEQTEIIGMLPPRINARQILITPITGMVTKDFQPVPNEEVAIVFHLSLSRFLTSDCYHYRSFEYRGIEMNIPFFDDYINGEQVTTWGLTATVCVELAVALFQQETEFDFFPTGKLYPDDPFKQQLFYLTTAEEQDSKEQSQISKL